MTAAVSAAVHTAGLPALDHLLAVAAADAVAAERAALLTDRTADALRRSQVLRALVPSDLGGLGMPLVDAARLTARLAEADGTTGWVQQLCAGPAWFIGVMPPGLAAHVFGRPDAWVGGSGMPGSAVPGPSGDGSLTVTGTWPWCSGAPWASALTLAVTVAGGGPAVVVLDLDDEVRAGRVPTVVLHRDDTDLRGFAAAGNWAAELREHRVPADRVFGFGQRHRSDPLFRVPFMTFAEVSMTAAGVGTARRLVAEFTSLARTKTPAGATAPLVADPVVRSSAARTVAALRTAEAAFWQAVDALGAEVETGEATTGTITAVTLAALHAVATGAEAAEALALLAGTDALSPTGAVARCVAELRAVRTNAVVSHRRWADAADAVFGPAPG